MTGNRVLALISGARLLETRPAQDVPSPRFPPAMAVSEQREIGRWRIIDELGVGTVGTVYRVRGVRPNNADRTTQGEETDAALKVLKADVSEDRVVKARFEREVEILERLSHPNVVAMYDSGRSSAGAYKGQLYYVMELVEGPSLKKVLDDQSRIPWQDVIEIGWQICSALQHAHNMGIVHRDLKPANLFLTTSGTVKLGDFGIALDTGAAELTETGLTVGTYAFMAPEQIRGDRGVAGQADLYALGCLLYRMLTGKNPYQGSNFAQIFDQHLHSKPPSVMETVDVPQRLDNLVKQLLAKTPEERPLSAREVQGVLSETLLEWDEDEGEKMRNRPATWAIDPGRTILSNLITTNQRAPSTTTSWTGIALLTIGLIAAIVAAAVFRK